MDKNIFNVNEYMNIPKNSKDFVDLLVKEVSTGEQFIIGDSTVITAASINHPGGNLGYRIEHNGAVFTYCSDVGHPDDSFDENLLKLAHW